MIKRAVAGVMAVAMVAGLPGCGLFGSTTARASSSSQDLGRDETGGLGVNSYLWRASLATVNFMPLASADPYGGIIMTDWYSNPAKPDERFKITVYILDTRLRADGVSCAVFKEQMVNGTWTTAAVSPDTNVQLENAILAKARELRLQAIE
jgi:hypothetical protein